eukprot:5765066-Pyramimonas_sp.AAC.1
MIGPEIPTSPIETARPQQWPKEVLGMHRESKGSSGILAFRGDPTSPYIPQDETIFLLGPEQ